MEQEYFLLLVQFARSGTKQLREFFLQKLRKIKQEQFTIKNRVHSEELLSLEHRNIYYSSWLPMAIHIATSIPELTTKEKLSERLKIPLHKIAEVLEFLVKAGLVRQEQGHFHYHRGQLHLEDASPLIAKHHTNWRLEAVKRLEFGSREELHYSSVVSLAERDIQKLQELMISCVEKIRTVVRDSPEERLYSYSLDLFPLDAN